MTLPVLSYFDYLREAFHANPRIPGLGSIPINKLALAGIGILGLANPGFWFAGIALETTYLYCLSTSPRFQKVVQSKHLGNIKSDEAEKIHAMILSLDKWSAERLNGLNVNLNEVNRLMEMDSQMEFIRESKQRTLAQLPTLFLRLLVTRKLVQQNLERTNIGKLEKSLENLKKQLEKPDLTEALAHSIKGNLDILERRRETLQRAGENLELIEMELNRIENQVQLVREEMAINRSPDSISSSVDRINSTLGETEEWMNSHSEFFTRISGSEEGFAASLPTSGQSETEK